MLGLPPEVLSELEEGNISVYKENILNRTENILNVFLKNIDTDIQKVYYEKSVAGMFIRYKLMVCRRINEVEQRTSIFIRVYRYSIYDSITTIYIESSKRGSCHY